MKGFYLTVSRAPPDLPSLFSLLVIVWKTNFFSFKSFPFPGVCAQILLPISSVFLNKQFWKRYIALQRGEHLAVVLIIPDKPLAGRIRRNKWTHDLHILKNFYRGSCWGVLKYSLHSTTTVSNTNLTNHCAPYTYAGHNLAQSEVKY